MEREGKGGGEEGEGRDSSWTEMKARYRQEIRDSENTVGLVKKNYRIGLKHFLVQHRSLTHSHINHGLQIQEFS